MKYMKTILAAAAAVITVFSAPAFAQDVVVDYENLIAVLSGRHGGPEADYWARLEPRSAKQNLLRMIDDPNVFTVARARAMAALKHFDGAEVEEILARKAKTEKTAYLRASAWEALAGAMGEKAVPRLSEAFSDDDVMVRLTAARALRKIGGGEARKSLERGLEMEKNSTARTVISNTLDQMR